MIILVVKRLNMQRKARFLPTEEITPSPLVYDVDEALEILDKINLFRSKSRPLETGGE